MTWLLKARTEKDHLQDLKVVFDLMRKHQLKINPTKSLGVSSRKFLGFIVTSIGIHLDPEKVKTILEIQPPRVLKELIGLQGKLAYIQSFISNLSGSYQPLT